MTPGQARWVPSTQAMVYALAGLVAGVPLGVAAALRSNGAREWQVRLIAPLLATTARPVV